MPPFLSVFRSRTPVSAIDILRTAPVVDDRRRVVGMARRAELQAGRGRRVEQVLDPVVRKVRHGTLIEALPPLLAVLYRAHIVEAVVAGRAA